MSPFLSKAPSVVAFELKNFTEIETEKFNKDYDLEDIISWGVLDVNRYTSQKLNAKIKDFLVTTDYQTIANIINNLKNTRFLMS
jgi:hypothetical protein